MGSRIDLVVGGVRAAELVNAYRERLERLDLLPPSAALEVACYAYASGCVHLLVAPGQAWVRSTAVDDGDGPDAKELLVLEVENSEAGHFAVCREPCGIVARVPLDALGRNFELSRWPQDQDQLNSW
ncbi:hypothetical protein [Streptomyces sp. NBC_01264]|uniref:hypothetical protein n=1 Tax=Streptomyces sp. NBC_01264 TaxID=2903804 RepID=UPI00225A9CEB|nr:hypothetical protein [Streptomyces sp. NBC_01264]MCX4781819.1 hypothetical protein [Streptomyces sp. NBC_01264]